MNKSGFISQMYFLYDQNDSYEITMNGYQAREMNEIISSTFLT